jgi:hypothetical protein
MDGAEAAFDESTCAGRDRNQADGVESCRCLVDAVAQTLGKDCLELVLAVPLEGQEGLGQFLAVHAGSDNGEDHATVHFHQGRRLFLGPERVPGQQADLALTAHAQCQVLRTAADTVHRERKCQELGSGDRREIRGAQPCGGLPAAVLGGRPGRQ